MAYFTVLLWAVLMFVGSRTSFSGFPQRFGRDLGVPLALLAALALVTILRSLPRDTAPAILHHLRRGAPVRDLVGVRAAQSLKWAQAPSFHMMMTPRIAAAGDWLEEHNKGGNIIVSPHADQVPEPDDARNGPLLGPPVLRALPGHAPEGPPADGNENRCGTFSGS